MTLKRQIVGNKVYLHRIVTETLDQMQNIYSSRKLKIQSYGFT